LGDIRYVSATA